jgi:hypothetical protein
MATELNKLLLELKQVFVKASKAGASLADGDPVKGTFLDFRQQQKEGIRKEMQGLMHEIERIVEKSEPWVKKQFEKLKKEKTTDSVDDFIEVLEDLKPSPGFDFKTNILPADIRNDVEADLAELNKCFESACYRSAVMICGRILETALHRKYFEATGNDLLEKAPGIGLGNLIAKLAEKNIAVDPALGNQIHLINQVRVFSVHKKQESFFPSKQQTNAIMLYTLDAIEKLFK